MKGVVHVVDPAQANVNDAEKMNDHDEEAGGSLRLYLQNSNGNAALMLAAGQSREACVKRNTHCFDFDRGSSFRPRGVRQRLVEAGAALDLQTSDGYTALLWAAYTRGSCAALDLQTSSG